MTDQAESVATIAEFAESEIRRFLERVGMRYEAVEPGAEIPGSFWGDSEAGLIGNTLFARPDTPIHSMLHEACHYLCMDKERQQTLHTDAGGDYDEENAVCYLQLLLADRLPGYDRERCYRDMDAWGYSFRLGSARAWFEQDAEDARQWLEARGLLKLLH
ncbi:hypothetical protein [Wenzhouxiangella marina]|uniref:Uncharacterized protein n=1 Tax=Wenzhouxiangella marina TaxID=1579979 RepID=A0A0K0XTL5_9GAMM|nr:hypothetical protein WM2015_673 [Wenzhouxiangella marina]MBB6087932.1 hypothetical protein [Wenzhouxiangella marina]